MRSRPFSLIFCSLLFLYYPFEWLARLFQGELFSWGDLLFSVVFPALLLVGLIRVVKVGWYTLIAFGFLWGSRDLYQFYAGQGTELFPILMHLFIYFLSLSYFINPRIRHLYFDPKTRWWRTKHRFETHGPILIRHLDCWHYPVLRNISEGGCFIETPFKGSVNEAIQLAIPLPIPLNVSVIQTDGEIRWVSQDPSRPGMGVQFKTLPAIQHKAIKSFLKRQL